MTVIAREGGRGWGRAQTRTGRLENCRQVCGRSWAGEGFPFTRADRDPGQGRPTGSMAATTEHRLTTGTDDHPDREAGPSRSLFSPDDRLDPKVPPRQLFARKGKEPVL